MAIDVILWILIFKLFKELEYYLHVRVLSLFLFGEHYNLLFSIILVLFIIFILILFVLCPLLIPILIIILL